MTEKISFKDQYPFAWNFLGIIGGITILSKSYKFISFLSKSNYFRPFSANRLYERYGNGTWAVITGATDGIGKEYATKLASLGYNIILIGRSESKLSEVSKEILKENNIQTKNIIIDLNNSSKFNEFDPLIQTLSNLEISFLVNSAGVTHTNWHDNLNEKEILEIININCVAPTLLINKIIPLMKKRDKHSAILNIGSLLGEHPMPFLANYSASKAYISALSKSLNIENFEKIDIMSVNPYYVSTKMTRYQKVDFETRTPQEVVDSSLRDIGRKKISHGHLNHEILNYLFSAMPEKYYDNRFREKMLAITNKIQAIKQAASKRRRNTEKDK